MLATKQKVYFGAFFRSGRVVKRTGKAFKRAADAEQYAWDVFSRYQILLDVMKEKV